MRLGITSTFVERCRRTDSPVRPILIAQTVAKNANGTLREHTRVRKDQWQEADDTTGFDLPPEGDVRLHDNIQTLVSQTSAPNTFTDIDGVPPHDVLQIEWGGTEPSDLEISRLKLWLVPRI